MNIWRLFPARRSGGAAQNEGPAAPQELAPAIESEGDSVAGERGVASVHRARSLQSRLSGVLAAGLMSVLALGALTWYYAHTFARQSQAEAAAATKSKKPAQGEMTLPPLGRVDPPIVERVLGVPPDPPASPIPASEPLAVIRPQPRTVPSNSGYGVATAPDQHASQRRLSGPVFVNAKDAAGPEQSGVDPRYMTDAASQPSVSLETGEHGPGTGVLSGLLQPTPTAAVRAKVLPTERLLLPKGAFLDCTLETAIDSSLPGMTTCVTATDTFGADGTVVLLERGTKLVGETRGDVRHGTARVYVLWTEARTPAGVVVPLASPGTDELGRAGLPGELNRHFFERFGAAILVSVIDGAVQAAVQRSSDGSGTVVVNPSTSQDIMTEVLRSTINIPPTVTKPNGDRIAVLVARDLDFRSVYELRPLALAR